MKVFQLVVCALLAGTMSYGIAQDGENMVPNGSFEDYGKKLKKKGQIEEAEGWMALTAAKADLFGTRGADEVKPGGNYMGKEDPYEGGAMAGIVMFSPKNRVPRQYISTKLNGVMVKGRKYCVSYRISLAEGSKYACNNVGVNFSKRQPILETKGIITDDIHVKDVNNQVFKGTYNWDVVCGVYTAKGGEKFINLGNFQPESNTTFEKVRLVDKSMEQINAAYYYIDDVQVIEIETNDECQCFDQSEDESLAATYSPPTIVSMEGIELEKLAAAASQYFTHGGYEVSANGGQANLDSLAAFMKVNSGMTITLYGNADETEEELGLEDPKFRNLGQRRINAVKDYLVSKGVDASRIQMKNNRDSAPTSESRSEAAQMKNRRVEIKFNT